MKLILKICFYTVVIFVIVAAVLLWRSKQPDLLEHRIIEATGTKAVNCGIVYIGEVGAKAKADACAEAAFKAHKPFRIRYNERKQSVPFSYVGRGTSTAVVGTPHRQVYVIFYLCSYWHGFRYRQWTFNNYPKMVVRDREGKLTLRLGGNKK